MVLITRNKSGPPASNPATIINIITSATTFHLLVKLTLLILIIWVAFVRKPTQLVTSQITQKLSERVLTTSIVIVIALIFILTLKRGCWYSDDLFFLAICLLIWVYVWKQSHAISTFISSIQPEYEPVTDYILPNAGTTSQDLKGIRGSSEITESRTGNLPEHYDYLPDDDIYSPELIELAKMQKESNTTYPAYRPYEPGSPNIQTELEPANYINETEDPGQGPVYKLANEVLVALDDTCQINQLTQEQCKPATEYMRRNGVGQSKWAFINELDSMPTPTGSFDICE